MDLLTLFIFGVILYFGYQWLNGKSKAGQSTSSTNPSNRSNGHSFERIRDKYETLEQVQQALREAGLEASNLVIGIDYTGSNRFNGARTFGGRCLHDIVSSDKPSNPYQAAISIIAKTLEPFDEDKRIPTYGFGDVKTKDVSVFSLAANGKYCEGLNDVMSRYAAVTPSVQLSGPTSFAPIIRKAIQHIQVDRGYHILVIIADGEVTCERETVDAIVDACNYPLSIVVVGVGDSDFELMRKFDDELPQRAFDNFQFVDFHSIMRSGQHREANFALAALMEVPEQYKTIRKLKLL